MSNRTRSDRASSGSITQVQQHVDGITTTLTLHEQPEGGFSTVVNVRYGTILAPLALNLSRTVTECPDAFAGGTETAAGLREEAQRHRDLSTAKDKVTGLLGLINSNLRECTGKLVFDVDRTLQGISSKLGDPFTDPRLRTRLEAAAQDPLAMVSARREAISSANLLSRTKNAETAEAEAEAEANAAALRLAEEEIKRMRPEGRDSAIVVPPQPAPAARSTRRSGRGTRRKPR